MLRLFSIFVLVTIILFFLSHGSSFSQNPLLRNYTTNDGLPSYEVYMCIQDRSGYMWFATNYGVSRYDGYSFESFNTRDGLTDNTVYELFEDYKGRIWFVTSNLKLSYIENNRIKEYKYNDSISKYIVRCPFIENRNFFVDKNDNVFISGYQRGAFVIDNKGNLSEIEKEKGRKYKMILNNGYGNGEILSCYESKIDILWYEVGGELYNCMLHSTVFYANRMKLNLKDGRRLFSQDNHIFDITGKVSIKYKMNDYIISLDEDNFGNVWVGLRNNGVVCYIDGDFDSEPAFHLLKGLPVSNTLMDRENGVWFTTTTGGVYYTPSLFFGSYTSSDGLLNNNVRALYQRNDGAVNVITNSRGVNVIKSGKCTSNYFEVTEGEYIVSEIDYKKGFIIGTNRKLYKCLNNRTESLGTGYYSSMDNYKWINGVIWNENFFNSDGKLYLCAKAGIGIYRNDSVIVLKHPEVLLRPQNIVKCPDGRLFFSSQYGIGEILGDSVRMLHEENKVLEKRSTWVLCNPVDTSLWISTKGEGIMIYRKGEIKWITMNDGLSSNNIKHLALGPDEIWASTNNGISRIFLDKQPDEKWLIQKINTENGLISNDINQVLVDSNKLYVATDKGLTVFDIRQLDTDLPKRNGVLLKGIKINERDTTILSFYSLPWNTSTITINYSYLSFINPGKINYIYRIKGLSDKWTETRSTEIRLTTLPPGQYEIEIFALFNDGDKCRFPAVVRFEIRHPFWVRWWFILLSVFMIFSFVAGISYYRIRQINRRNKLQYKLLEYQRKALSSQMNPHFIFNSLNSIQLYILKNDVRTSNRYLTKFSSLMRNVLVNSNEASISLANEITTLQSYIELEALRFDNKFSFSINCDPKIDPDSVYIPTLLVQPFVENAIWHGLMNKESSGKITVEFMYVSSKSVKCTITDDGVGRKAAEEINVRKRSGHKSLGAKITEERLELLGRLYQNELKVTYTDLIDDNGKASGTKAEIIIPLVEKDENDKSDRN